MKKESNLSLLIKVIKSCLKCLLHFFIYQLYVYFIIRYSKKYKNIIVLSSMNRVLWLIVIDESQ